MYGTRLFLVRLRRWGVIEHWSREAMRKYEKDPGAIPDWVTAVNLLANVAAAGLLVTGFVLTR